MSLNGSTVEIPPSSPSSLSDTITNITFGLCAFVVGIVTMWQGRRAYRKRYIVAHGNAIDEGGAAPIPLSQLVIMLDRVEQATNHEFNHITSAPQDPNVLTGALTNIEGGIPASTVPSDTEVDSLGASLAASAASSALGNTDAAMPCESQNRSVGLNIESDLSPLLEIPSPSGARPVMEGNHTVLEHCEL